MKKLLLIPFLALAAYAAEPFLARPLLVEPTNATPVSPAGFFASNSPAINGVISSVTNVYLKGVTTLMVTPAEPGANYKVVFHGDADSELAAASTVSYSDMPLKSAANTFTATNSMPELQVKTLRLTNNITRTLVWLDATDSGSNYVLSADVPRYFINMVTNVNILSCTNRVSTTNEQKDVQITLRNMSGYNLTNTCPAEWQMGKQQTVISNNTTAVMALSNWGPDVTNVLFGIATKQY